MNEKQKFTYDQVNKQEVSAYTNHSGDKPRVPIKRTDGRVTVGELDTDTRDVDFVENGEAKAHEAVPLEELSDQRQAELAGRPLRDNEMLQDPGERIQRGLGGEAVRQAGYGERTASSNGEALKTDEEEDDAEALRRLQRNYNEALAEKRRAQQEGRGEDSTYWGRIAGQYARDYQRLTGRSINY